MACQPSACVPELCSIMQTSPQTDTGRCWIYVQDDRPFGGAGPPAAMFYYSRDRKGEHPQGYLARYAGIL